MLSALFFSPVSLILVFLVASCFLMAESNGQRSSWMTNIFLIEACCNLFPNTTQVLLGNVWLSGFTELFVTQARSESYLLLVFFYDFAFLKQEERLNHVKNLERELIGVYHWSSDGLHSNSNQVKRFGGASYHFKAKNNLISVMIGKCSSPQLEAVTCSFSLFGFVFFCQLILLYLLVIFNVSYSSKPRN